MGHSYIFLLIIMQEKLIYFQKMTSCKLRVKLRVTFSELFVEEYRKNRLMGRSVSPNFLNIPEYITKIKVVHSKVHSEISIFCTEVVFRVHS